MVEKKGFWLSVLAGTAVAYLVLIIAATITIKPPIVGPLFTSLLITPLVGGLIAGYLFKEGFIGGMVAGLAVAIFSPHVIPVLLVALFLISPIRNLGENLWDSSWIYNVSSFAIYGIYLLLSGFYPYIIIAGICGVIGGAIGGQMGRE